MRFALSGLVFLPLACTTFSPADDARDANDAGALSNEAGGEADSGPPPIARDSFTRPVSAGFGTAEIGGAWTVTGGAVVLNVSEGTGNMLTKAGAQGTAELNDVAETDVDEHVVVTSDRFHDPQSSVYVTLVARHTGSLVYNCTAHVQTDGEITLGVSSSFGEMNGLVGKTSALFVMPNEAFHLRFVVTGTRPTRLRCRVWKGELEPADWLLEAKDTTAELQAKGNVGVRAYLSASATVETQVRFDDFLVTRPSP